MSKVLLHNNKYLKKDISNINQSGLTRIVDTTTNVLLDENNKIKPSYLPSIALTNVYVVDTYEERDALSVQSGDSCKVLLDSKFYLYDGTQWIEMTASNTLESLTDVLLTTPTNEQILKYDSTSAKWKNQNPPSPPSLSTLTDTVLNSSTDGEFLGFQTSSNKWKNLNVDHNNLLNKGSNTHAQIDTSLISLNSSVSSLSSTVSTHTSDISSLNSSQSSQDSTIGLHTFILSGLQNVLTTKGDLFTYDSAYKRLPIGANSQILSADSTTSTGLKWINNNGASVSYFPLEKLTNSNISNIANNDIIINSAQAIIFANNGVYKSSNLSSRTLISSIPVNVVGYAYGSTLNPPFYLAVSTNGTIYKTFDNVTFTTLTTNLSALGVTGVMYVATNTKDIIIFDTVNNKFILGFSSGSAASHVAYSSDGVTWSLSSGVLNDVYGLTYKPDYSVIMVATSSYKIFKSVDYGLTFSQVGGSNVNNYEMTYSPTLNLFACVGDYGLKTSSDGTTWTLINSAFGYGVCWVASLGLFITVSGDHVYTSSDGVTFTDRGACGISSNKSALITFIMNKYVCIFDNSNTSKFVYSSDPINGSWSSVTTGNISFITNYNTWNNSQLSTSQISDLSFSSLADKNLMVYDVSTSKWKNKTGLTTKGDILTYSTDYNRLGVGSNGQVLTADSTQTNGIKWATPSSYTSPTIYTTKELTGNVSSLTIDGTQRKLMSLTVGAAGKYMLTYYLRCYPSGTSYIRIQLKINGSTNSADGTTPNGLGEQTNDFVCFSTVNNALDSWAFNGSFFVTTLTASASVEVWADTYSGSCSCISYRNDNTNFGSVLQCVGAF